MGRVPRTVLLLLITGISLYLVFPSLLQVLSAWPRLKTLEPLWFIAMVVAEALSFVALWVLQRIAVRSDDMYAVATSQLAGNAFGRIVPGGGAAAGALQYKMLVQSGTPGGRRLRGSPHRRCSSSRCCSPCPCSRCPRSSGAWSRRATSS